MYSDLQTICERPVVWSICSTESLWTHLEIGQHRSNYPLNPSPNMTSRCMTTIDATVAWIIDRFGTVGLNLCDLGCGSGLYTQRLARAGVDVTGVEASASALAHARRTASRSGVCAAYHRANYLDWHSEQRFDLVILTGGNFCSLNPKQRALLLQKIRHYLKPDGHLLLDVYSIEAFAKRTEQQRVESNRYNNLLAHDDYYAIVSTFVYPEERVSLDKYSIYEKSGERRTLLHWQQYFCSLILVKELEAAGFSVVETLANLTGKPYRPDATEFSVVCRYR